MGLNQQFFVMNKNNHHSDLNHMRDIQYYYKINKVKVSISRLIVCLCSMCCGAVNINGCRDMYPPSPFVLWHSPSSLCVYINILNCSVNITGCREMCPPSPFRALVKILTKMMKIFVTNKETLQRK